MMDALDLSNIAHLNKQNPYGLTPAQLQEQAAALVQQNLDLSAELSQMSEEELADYQAQMDQAARDEMVRMNAEQQQSMQESLQAQAGQELKETARENLGDLRSQIGDVASYYDRLGDMRDAMATYTGGGQDLDSSPQFATPKVQMPMPQLASPQSNPYGSAAGNVGLLELFELAKQMTRS